MASGSGTTSSGVTEDSGKHRIDKRIDSLMEAHRNQFQTVTPKIQKVPRFLRDNFVMQYEPTNVSLGPIHYQRGKDYKEILKNGFVQASGKEFNVLYRQIKTIINQLRDCFEEEVTKDYNDDALALLLCEDGCAILQYIYIATTRNMFDGTAQDILLLENQIPYKVLKELMQLSKETEGLQISIATFIEESVMVRLDEQSKKKAAEGNRGDNLPSQANPQLDVQIDGDPVHLLDLLRKTLLGVSQAETLKSRRDSSPFRKVQELKAAGIYLRRSSDRFLSNISFRRGFLLLGRLYLPPITVKDSARLKFLNLVAYEMCLQKDRGVMSYLFFLNSLINEAQDVKELRDAGVLSDYNRSDTELQNFFSVICPELGSDLDNYIGVKQKIEDYHGTFMSKMLQLYHDYIKDSSWPLIIMLAVLLDLLFGGTQTLISVKTWFSVSPAPAPAPATHPS